MFDTTLWIIIIELQNRSLEKKPKNPTGYFLLPSVVKYSVSDSDNELSGGVHMA